MFPWLYVTNISFPLTMILEKPSALSSSDTSISNGVEADDSITKQLLLGFLWYTRLQ